MIPPGVPGQAHTTPTTGDVSQADTHHNTPTAHLSAFHTHTVAPHQPNPERPPTGLTQPHSHSDDDLRQAHLTHRVIGQARRPHEHTPTTTKLGQPTTTTTHTSTRTHEQQPRARSNEHSNEENHSPAHAPPRARPYATTASPRGRLPGPRNGPDRRACYALTSRASLRSESITFAHYWGVMAPRNHAELWRAGSGRGASGTSQPKGAGRQAGVIYLAPQDRFSLNSLRGRTRTARTGVPRMFHTNPLVAIFR